MSESAQLIEQARHHLNHYERQIRELETRLDETETYGRYAARAPITQRRELSYLLDYLDERHEDTAQLRRSVSETDRVFADFEQRKGREYWDPEKATGTRESATDFRIEFDGHGLLNEPPEKYWVNVTDTQGNERMLLLDVKEGGGAKLAAAGVVAGTAVSYPKPDPFPEEVVGLGILGLSAGGAYLVNEYLPATGETIRQRSSLTSVERVYQPAETAGEFDYPIRLPSGVVDSAYDPRIGREVHRGHGWEYIETVLPGVTHEEIGEVLRAPNVITEDGSYAVVIGETDAREEVILTIIGGLLVSASEQAVYNEECGETINIDNNYGTEGNPEHTIREDKPMNSLAGLREALKKPTAVVDVAGKRYYIKRFGTNEYGIFVAHEIAKGVYYELVTQLTNKGKSFRTLEDAKEFVDDEGDAKVVHDPENGVNC